MNKMGSISLFLSAAIYGSFGVLITGMGRELSVNDQIMFRYGMACLLMLGMIVITKAKLRLSKGVIPMMGIFLIIMQISIWAFTKGAMLTTLPSLLGAFYIGSITTSIVVASLLLRESIELKNWLTSTALIITIYALSGASGNQEGLMWGFVAGSLENVTQIIRGRLNNVSKGMLTLITLVGVLLITFVQSLFAGKDIYFPREVETWIYGVTFGLLVICVNILVTHGFRKVAANIGSVIMSSEIAFGSIFSYLFMRIKPNAMEIITGIVVMSVVAIQNLEIKENNTTIVNIRNMLEE